VAELITLGERLISGKGVLKVPDMDESFRYYMMSVNVIREPENQSISYEWNPPKAFYARLVFRRDKYVLFDDSVRYDGQLFQYVNDPCGQTLIAVKCAYDGILQSFVNLVNGIAGTPGGVGIFVTGVTDLIQDYENLSLGWDEVLFNCYSSTALQVRFFGLKYDSCDPDKDKKHTPPPPPPPLPKVPPGTPIASLSPPYDPDTDDEGNTDPYENDTTEPVTEECLKYSVSWSVTYNDGVGIATASGTTTMFGIVGDYRVDDSISNNWKLLIFNQGIVNNQFSECTTYEERPLFQGGNDYQNVVVGQPVLVP